MPKFESFDGTKLSYEIDGDGAAVVLIHGYASDSYINWVRPGIVDRLNSSGYKTIALDQRGHGMSEKPHDEQAYADSAMVKDVQALFDHLSLDACACVGFSMGARNTLDLLTTGEERIKVAVLGGIGSNMLIERDHGNVIADAMRAEDKSTIDNPFAKSFRDFADLTKGDRVALAAIMSRPRPPLTGLENIDVPVLILNGDNDPMIGEPSKLADKIPGAKVATVGGTHLNVINNREFHRELVEFLDEHKGGSGE